MSVFIHLFHGRKSPSQDMDEMGEDGPWLGPFDYVHITYMGDVKIGSTEDNFEGHLNTYEGLVYLDGAFYGDFSVNTHDKIPESSVPFVPNDHQRAIPPIAVMQCCKCRIKQVHIGTGKPLECVTDICNSTVFQQVTKLQEEESPDEI